MAADHDIDHGAGITVIEGWCISTCLRHGEKLDVITALNGSHGSRAKRRSVQRSLLVFI